MAKAKTTGSMVIGTMNLSAVVRSKKKMLTLSPRRKGAARKMSNWIDVTSRRKAAAVARAARQRQAGGPAQRVGGQQRPERDHGA